MVYYYDIHGILRILSNIDPFLLNRILPRIFLRGTINSAVDLRILHQDFRYEERNDKVLYYEGPFKKGVFKAKLLLSSFAENPTDLLFLSPRYRLFHKLRDSLFKLLFEVIEIKLLQRGFCFIHSGCVEKDGKAILFTAPANTGKTSTVLKLTLEREYNFLSDDMTLLGNSNIVYSYPIALTCHAAHLNLLKARKGIARSIKYKSMFSKIPIINKIVSSESKVDILTLIPKRKISQKAKVDKIFFLELGNDCIKQISNEEARRRISLVGQMHRDLLNEAFARYAYYCGMDLWKLIMIRQQLFEQIVYSAETYIVRSRTGRFAEMIFESGLI